MGNSKNDIFTDVAAYYTDKLDRFGESPKGVDWNSLDSQVLRFEQLCKIIRSREKFSINDLGCGYGALYKHLKDHYSSFDYVGIDVSEDMISSASLKYQHNNNARFLCSNKSDTYADYSVASGLFNVRMGYTDLKWKLHIESILDVLNQTSRLAFSFNCLTTYSDTEKMKDNLYYMDPCEIFDFCKTKYSPNVALLHDYELYEFTILVKK